MAQTKVSKVLLVRFSAFGDVIQTLPVLTMLRERFPDAKIGWAIDTELAPAIEGHPALDYIHRCSRNRWKRELSRPSHWPAVRRDFSALVEEVRAIGYDVSLDVQGFSRLRCFRTWLVSRAALDTGMAANSAASFTRRN